MAIPMDKEKRGAVVGAKAIKLPPQSVVKAGQAGWTNLATHAQAKPVLLLTPEHGIVALFHGATNEEYYKSNPHLLELMDTADVIVCCYPNHLPEEMRVKHIFPGWKGPIGTIIEQGHLKVYLFENWYNVYP